jgi:hypothetical protein
MQMAAPQKIRVTLDGLAALKGYPFRNLYISCSRPWPGSGYYRALTMTASALLVTFQESFTTSWTV